MGLEASFQHVHQTNHLLTNVFEFVSPFSNQVELANKNTDLSLSLPLSSPISVISAKKSLEGKNRTDERSWNKSGCAMRRFINTMMISLTRALSLLSRARFIVLTLGPNQVTKRNLVRLLISSPLCNLHKNQKHKKKYDT